MCVCVHVTTLQRTPACALECLRLCKHSCAGGQWGTGAPGAMRCGSRCAVGSALGVPGKNSSDRKPESPMIGRVEPVRFMRNSVHTHTHTHGPLLPTPYSTDPSGHTC